VSPVELVRASLARIEQLQPKVNAFAAVCPERALDEAQAIERRMAAGEDVGPLAGLPLGVKDLEDVAGLPTTFGSRPYRDHVATRDSVLVSRLRAAGAIVVGKTTTPEFGYTAITKSPLCGVTRNPWNLERTPGGSSGGSAAALAAGMVPLVTGSDGGGSIRIPAAYVGAYGLKPTFGRVPAEGLSPNFPMCSWIDTVCWGPITRTVRDAALFMDVAAGPDPRDPTSLPAPQESYLESLADLPRGLPIALSKTLGYAMVQDDVWREVEQAAQTFRALGHRVEPIDDELPNLGVEWALISAAEDYARIGGDFIAAHREEWGRAFIKGVERARDIGPEFMARAYRKRALLHERLAHIFGRYALLLTPTMPTEAFGAGGPFPTTINGQPLTQALGAVAFTYPFNFSGHPAATVRAGFTDAGLPAGLQIVGPRFRDDLVLQASYAYEQARPWNDRWPELA
jgi:aspartyl-tRNA(Asn)/glutamyl-tRNA(Gln) amidotransferase subunit A